MRRALLITRSALVVVAVVVVQTSILTQLRVAGIVVDLVVVVAAAAGVAGGPERGAGFGFAIGLVYDAFLQTPFGLSALCYCLVAWAAGALTASRSSRMPVLDRLLVGVASGFGTALFLVLGLLLGQGELLSLSLAPLLLVVTVGGLLLGGLAVRSLRWTLGTTATRAVVD